MNIYVGNLSYQAKDEDLREALKLTAKLLLQR